MSAKDKIKADLDLLYQTFGMESFSIYKAQKIGISLSDLNHLKMFGCIAQLKKDNSKSLIIIKNPKA